MLEAFDTQTLYEHVVKYYKDNAIPLDLQVDGICVLNEGILKNFKHAQFNPYGLVPSQPVEKPVGVTRSGKTSPCLAFCSPWT